MRKNLIKKFFKFKKKKRTSQIRGVIFGLHIRYLGLLSVVILCIVIILTLAMFINQQRVLTDEKNNKARTLIRILSEPAETYLDVNINTSFQESREKFNFISRECSNFKNYNKDIFKILIANEKAKIVYSTNKKDINTSPSLTYVKRGLILENEKPHFYDFRYPLKGKNRKKYRVVYYPLFLHQGNLISVLQDFKKYYTKYHSSSRKTKNSIYLTLWKKYADFLDDDFKPEPKQQNQQDPINPQRINKAWDIDFLFLKLFANIMNTRRKSAKKNELWLWQYSWLYKKKQEKAKAYLNDNVETLKKSHDYILEKIQYLADQIEENKRLGVIAILFDVDQVNQDFNKDLKNVLIIALIVYVISIVFFFFVVSFMVKNLKKLEKWALKVSEGDLDAQVQIASHDEIGRLADIFNKMLDDLKVKFHLEKFVSRSTRSMITRKKKQPIVTPGQTGKKQLSFVFSDVRGFTSFSEKNDPELVMKILNDYFDLQAKIIRRKKGDIDDYVGDQIMAHFGGEKQADTAINVAIEIMKEVTRFNEKRKKIHQPFFEIGIGVHGGNVVVGNIGAGFRMDFACIGDAVNLTSRLCSKAEPGQILISKELITKAKTKFKTEQVSSLSVKGKSGKIQVVSAVI